MEKSPRTYFGFRMPRNVKIREFLYLLNYAVIFSAINNCSFCKGAKEAMKVLIENALRVTAINSVGDFALFVGKLAITAGVVGVGWAFFIVSTTPKDMGMAGLASSWAMDIDEALSEGYRHGGPGVCLSDGQTEPYLKDTCMAGLGDGQTEAGRVPSQGGRGDALLRRMPPYLT